MFDKNEITVSLPVVVFYADDISTPLTSLFHGGG